MFACWELAKRAAKTDDPTMRIESFASLFHRPKAPNSLGYGWLHFHLLAFIWLAIIAAGCEQPVRIWSPSAEAEPEHSTIVVLVKGPGADLPKELNSAKAAALYVSSLPNVDNLWIRREIGLHAALYKASYVLRLGDASRGFLLDEPKNADTGALEIDLGEFRLRVLAELSELGPPLEWAMQGNHSSGSISGVLDGSGKGSGIGRIAPTHLGFRIFKRIDDQATVLAEVSSYTPMARSVRQQVSCTYDGRQWTVAPKGLRTVW